MGLQRLSALDSGALCSARGPRAGCSRGRNATGVTFLLDELASKRLDILKQIAPRVSRVGFLSNPDHLDNEWRQAARAAGALAVEPTPLEVRRAADFDTAFQTAMSVRVDALYVVSSRLTAQQLDRIVTFAAEHRLPLAGGWGDWAQQGGLLSYGPNVDDMIGRAVTYVDRILKGAKPADLPVQQPSKFELVINLKASKRLASRTGDPARHRRRGDRMRGKRCRRLCRFSVAGMMELSTR